MPNTWQHATSKPAAANTTSTTSTTGSSTTSTTPTTPATTQTTTFTGAAFSISYPANWVVKADQKQFSWGTDTTIVSPTDPNVLVRVDVTQHVKTNSPLTSAKSVINTLAAEPGYQQVALSANSINGMPGEYWEFLDTESGVSMHKVDEFLIDFADDEGIAVLTQAPASEWASLSQMFTTLRNSFH